MTDMNIIINNNNNNNDDDMGETLEIVEDCRCTSGTPYASMRMSFEVELSRIRETKQKLELRLLQSMKNLRDQHAYEVAQLKATLTEHETIAAQQIAYLNTIIADHDATVMFMHNEIRTLRAELERKSVLTMHCPIPPYEQQAPPPPPQKQQQQQQQQQQQPVIIRQTRRKSYILPMSS
jgi:hypothetical protein